MKRKKNTVQIPELDLFSVQAEFPKEIVNNQSDTKHFEDLDLSKKFLVCNVKKDNVKHFLNGTAKIYYTGKKFPSTVALASISYKCRL